MSWGPAQRWAAPILAWAGNAHSAASPGIRRRGQQGGQALVLAQAKTPVGKGEVFAASLHVCAAEAYAEHWIVTSALLWVEVLVQAWVQAAAWVQVAAVEVQASQVTPPAQKRKLMNPRSSREALLF